SSSCKAANSASSTSCNETEGLADEASFAMTHAAAAHQRLSKLRRYVNARSNNCQGKISHGKAIGKKASTSQIAQEGLTSFACSRGIRSFELRNIKEFRRTSS